LRRELEQRGHRFRTRSDTETVLNAFLEWDTECFSRLRGMFAVALWSESERRLVLARDRMGIKPLYIARRGDDLYFGSELKAILVHPEIERWLSLDGLDCYLSLNYVPAPWTLVEGIEKLLPGQWLEWRRGAIRTEPYWRLPQGSGRALDTEAGRSGAGSSAEAVGAGASVVRRAVGRLAQRRIGFLQPGALRGRGVGLASEDFFHHVSRPQL
jgi:asparagine synthase (glutamine-hydrolysing)